MEKKSTKGIYVANVPVDLYDFFGTFITVHVCGKKDLLCLVKFPTCYVHPTPSRQKQRQKVNRNLLSVQ